MLPFFLSPSAESHLLRELCGTQNTSMPLGANLDKYKVSPSRSQSPTFRTYRASRDAITCPKPEQRDH